MGQADIDFAAAYLKVQEYMKDRKAVLRNWKLSDEAKCVAASLSLNVRKLQNDSQIVHKGYLYEQPQQKDNNSQLELKFQVNGQSMGTLLKPNVEALKNIANPAPFGKGTETVIDENVRKCLEIPGDQITLHKSFQDHVRCLANGLSFAGVLHQLEPKLYKMHIYETGGFFDVHADTVHDENHIATMVVCLGSKHEGGQLSVGENDQAKEIDFADMMKNAKLTHDWLRKPCKETLPFAAFYTDCPHKVAAVSSGSRIVLQYDLSSIPKEKSFRRRPSKYQRMLKNHNDAHLEIDSPTRSSVEGNSPVLSMIKQELMILLSDKKYGYKQVAIPLKHLYPTPSLCNPGNLKGSDAVLHDFLKYDFHLELKSIMTSWEYDSYGDEYPRIHVQFRAFDHDDVIGKFKVNDRVKTLKTIALFPRDAETIAETGGEYTGNETAPLHFVYRTACLLVSFIKP